MKIPSVVLAFLSLSAHAQTFHNLDFSEACDTSRAGLCNWDLSWGGKGACVADRSGEDQCLLISGKSESSVGFAEQSAIILPAQGLRIVELSARIRSENVAGKGAGLNLGVYDRAGNLLFTKDMGYAGLNWVKGTRDWKEYVIRGIVPAGAANIKIGAILYGRGLARFDDYRVRIEPVEGRQPSQLAVDYITAACDTIARHSLYRDSIDMPALRQTALQIAGPASSTADCYLAVQYLLESLRPAGDHHSFFMQPGEVKAWESDGAEAANTEFARYKLMDDCGYVMVPPFHGGNKDLMQAYADTLQAALEKLSRSNVKGWIIDLRRNTGGNMEPMIAGLGPLFDAEKLGSLIDVEGQRESWYYRDGTYGWNRESLMKVSRPVKWPTRRPVAVLIGPSTGSSGEIVAISFRGNGLTLFFGQPTWGLTTGNGGFDLPDGARIMLASTRMADRNGKIYHGPIEPDVRIEPKEKTEGDPALKAAVEWVRKGGGTGRTH
jgi:hypothetical protein